MRCSSLKFSLLASGMYLRFFSRCSLKYAAQPEALYLVLIVANFVPNSSTSFAKISASTVTASKCTLYTGLVVAKVIPSAE